MAGKTPLLLALMIAAVGAGVGAYFWMRGSAPVDCEKVDFDECKDTPGCERLYIDAESGPSGKCVRSHD